MKINVIGTSGSGKSTLSRQISKSLNIPHIEMDRLFWKPNWKESNDEEFLEKVEKAVSEQSWVLDGNYSTTNEIKLRTVDIVIWIDFSFSKTLYQAIKRAVTRILTRVELWPDTGNRESLRMLFSKDSIILRTINEYAKNKKKFQSMMNAKKYSHIQFIRAQSLNEITAIVKLLKSKKIYKYQKV